MFLMINLRFTSLLTEATKHKNICHIAIKLICIRNCFGNKTVRSNYICKILFVNFVEGERFLNHFGLQKVLLQVLTEYTKERKKERETCEKK